MTDDSTWLQPELLLDAGRPRVEWMGFGPDVSDDAARSAFLKKYGMWPAEVRRNEGCVMAGPMPVKENDNEA